MIDDIISDKALYPMIWRLNSEDCKFTSGDKRKVVFLGEVGSENLWDLLSPLRKLMGVDYLFMSLLGERELDFDEVKEPVIFFSDELNGVSVLSFFWGRSDCAIIPSDVLIKAWDDFFYPSSGTYIILILNRDKIIYSRGENFFYTRKNG